MCGSRDWIDRDTIREVLSFYEDESPTIIQGEAQGADTLAAVISQGLGYRVFGYPADWVKYGKRAGLKRNLEMLDQKPDLVLAFQKNHSRGTQHTIDNARKRGIPVKVYTDDE